MRQLTYWVDLLVPMAGDVNVEPRIRVVALVTAHRLARLTRDWALVDTLITRAMELARQESDARLLTWVLSWQIKSTVHRCDYELALLQFEEQTQILAALGLPPVVPQQIDAAIALTRLGRLDEASALCEEGLKGAQETDWKSGASLALRYRGFIALRRGDSDTAEAGFREGMALAVQDGHLGEQTSMLEAFAQLSAARQEWRRAAILWGAADAGQVNYYRYRDEELDYAVHVAELAPAMGDAAFEAAHAHGYAMTLEQAVAFALEEESRGISGDDPVSP